MLANLNFDYSRCPSRYRAVWFEGNQRSESEIFDSYEPPLEICRQKARQGFRSHVSAEHPDGVPENKGKFFLHLIVK